MRITRKDYHMFTGFTIDAIDFMWNLRLNNNKAWFNDNKATYQQVFQAPMKALADEVFAKVSEEYKDHGFIRKVSRIYKDARRIRDGEPYKTSLWFSIERPVEDWTYTPVFWFELGPESWSYGLGYYQAKAKTMQNFRARLDNAPAEFERLIAPLNNQTEFILDGDEYARKKEAPTKLLEPWYNRKAFSLIHSQENGAELYTPDFATRLANGYKSLMPIYDYFITLDD